MIIVLPTATRPSPVLISLSCHRRIVPTWRWHLVPRGLPVGPVVALVMGDWREMITSVVQWSNLAEKNSNTLPTLILYTRVGWRSSSFWILAYVASGACGDQYLRPFAEPATLTLEAPRLRRDV